MDDGNFKLLIDGYVPLITRDGYVFTTEKEAGLTTVGLITVVYKCPKAGWVSCIMPTICHLWNKCGGLKTYLLNTVSRIRG
jgi:hypothetical protein